MALLDRYRSAVDGLGGGDDDPATPPFREFDLELFGASGSRRDAAGELAEVVGDLGAFFVEALGVRCQRRRHPAHARGEHVEL